MTTYSMRWFRLREVLNAKHHGKHWEIQVPKPLQGETAEQYQSRSLKFSEGVQLGNGVSTVVLLGYKDRVVHVGMTWQLIAMLRQARIRARHGELPKWDWVAISQGGDAEMRKLNWRARLRFTEVFKGAGKRNTAARVAVHAAEIQEQRRAEKMAEEKARLEAYNKKFQETLAAGDLPEAPDWQ